VRGAGSNPRPYRDHVTCSAPGRKCNDDGLLTVAFEAHWPEGATLVGPEIP